MDGPNYEKVFRGMQCLNNGTPDDVKIIKQYLRFYRESEEFAKFAEHYLPILPEADRAEFIDEEELSIEEVNEKLAELGIKPHHATGEEKRRQLLSEALNEAE